METTDKSEEERPESSAITDESNDPADKEDTATDPIEEASVAWLVTWLVEAPPSAPTKIIKQWF